MKTPPPKLQRITLLNTIVIFCFVFISCNNKKKETYKKLPAKVQKDVFTSTKQIPDAHFLGDQSCKECHQDQFEKWQGSHHDKSMQIATRETILADFKGEKFKSQGVQSRFFTKDGEFYANTEGPDGKKPRL